MGIMGFDLSSAFDTIDPTLFLPKLAALGISGTALAWFASYMKGGQQQVNWTGTLSGFVAMRYGVRQGSILGPLVFLIIMADLPQALKLFEEWMVGYADDVALWASHKNPEVVKEQLTKHAANLAMQQTLPSLLLNEDSLSMQGKRS